MKKLQKSITPQIYLKLSLIRNRRIFIETCTDAQPETYVNVERHLSGEFEQLTTCRYYWRNVVSLNASGI